jgi:hypothetical protein
VLDEAEADVLDEAEAERLALVELEALADRLGLSDEDTDSLVEGELDVTADQNCAASR